MRIRDIMRPGAFTIPTTEFLGNAYTAMKRSHTSHLPVTRDGALIGMLSERDVLAARARVRAADWWTMAVGDAMHAPLQTADPDDVVSEVAGRMAASNIGAMPVVEGGRLLGLATITDVLDSELRAAVRPVPSAATAVDAMTAYPRTIAPDVQLVDAVAIMVDERIRHLPVVDATSTIVGVLSERDVRTAIGDPTQFVAQRGNSLAQYRVRDVMTCPAVVVPFDRPLVELAQWFADGRSGALPVVDKFGAVIGIVSYVDVLRVLGS